MLPTARGQLWMMRKQKLRPFDSYDSARQDETPGVESSHHKRSHDLRTHFPDLRAAYAHEWIVPRHRELSS
jgi:hypothetical protein